MSRSRSLPSVALRGALLLLAAAAADPRPPAAQELIHHGTGVDVRVTQTLSFVDPWGETGDDALFLARPRDFENRVRTVERENERVDVQLLLHGDWGWHHMSYAESEIVRGDLDGSGLRTSRLALDVDGDGANEIVFLERRVGTQVPLGENGDPLPGGRHYYARHEIEVRVIDRRDGALVELPLTPDPDDPAFAALLQREHGGATNAALQLLAGDWLFNAERYAEARYRYQVAREWAERSAPPTVARELDAKMPLLDPDPDLPEFTWITAILRHSALPPFFRRRY